MNKRLVLVPLTLLGLALLVSACGGGSSSEGGGEEAAIEKTITDSVMKNEPSKCTDLMTLNFVEQTSDESGKAAVKECEEEATDTANDPKAVNVSEIEVEGSKATADVAFEGGGFDGQTLSVALVEEGGWKLDEITGFVKLDADALASTYEEKIEESTSEITPEQVKCIGDGIRNASEKEVEELSLGGSSQPLIELAESCE